MIATPFAPLYNWFGQQGWKPLDFQVAAWEAVSKGESGLINAPTGSGKTYSLLLPFLLRGKMEPQKGLQLIWITPIRALSKEIEAAAQRAIVGLDLDWTVGVRTGDTDAKTRREQTKQLPELLITTPESLHLLLAQKKYPTRFKSLQAIVVDEWHELLGSKRAVLMELALSRFRGMLPHLQTWGISATVGNMEDALAILLGSFDSGASIIKTAIRKEMEVNTILPNDVSELPWAGHLGLRMAARLLPILKESKSTLIFTNTRAQSEIWYQKILELAPELAGQMAMHHGSISKDIRGWVEDALHEGKLKAVVCTSSLDLGVDFRPVETIIQIGSPKGVARFIQRCGRSGHQPGAKSSIYFLPTHSLELIEAAALREAVQENRVEARLPYLRSFDVLVQYLMTLAVSEGFYPNEIVNEVRKTVSFETLADTEWQWCLQYLTRGGKSLEAYTDFHKVEIADDGKFEVNSRKIAMRHRMSIGTIVSDAMLQVRMKSGGYLGSIEEWFVSKLEMGDAFWFAGQNLEFIRIKDMTVQVQKSKKKVGKVPSYMGGRMPLSAQLGEKLREHIARVSAGEMNLGIEIETIRPLLLRQQAESLLPKETEFLIERYRSKEGFHLFFYPFEGRFVHEGLAALLAYRLSLFQPITFSIAMNDYGFELLSDVPIPIEEGLDSDVFTPESLWEDIRHSVNAGEMSKRKFRDIAAISGLVFGGFPGQRIKERHLQSSSQLVYEVFGTYEPDNLLFLQAQQEVVDFQLEEARMRAALERINAAVIHIVDIEKPTPFAFPILVDRLREKLTSEKLEDQIRKMQAQFS
ncbi:MAG: ligase-associated DNA damage response DEXH box helicase [Schleiferiaceae bacterium]|nr:ligase-associated DNA damage response DEXH box helicase [Schleiferiaceae bacterium]